jgi:tRNA-modifying protein YgfZ
MSVWTNFLAARGAVFDGDRKSVASFGDPAAELAGARDRAVICDLAPLGVISVAGPDAAAFLQGQLTNDLLSLAPGASQLTAWCSPKGRMLANFLARRVDGVTFELMLPATLLDSVRKRLTLFVLRSKLTISDASEASVRLGAGGPDAAAAIRRLFGRVPALLRSVVTADGEVVALPGGRFVCWASAQHAGHLWNRLAEASRPAGFPVWEWLTIQAGVPVITQPTADRFVPQMANWDALDGVSFQKGCYTGQEIVARTQYLGRLKERLVLAHVDGTVPVPGDRLYSAAFGDQACGSVVNAASAPGGGADLLAVLQLTARDSGAVRLGAQDGRTVSLLPLPYSIPAAAPPRARSM